MDDPICTQPRRMEPRLLTPIDYVEPPVDPWLRIFRILATISVIFGAFYVTIGAGGLHRFLNLHRLANPQSTLWYWGPLVIPLIDVFNGAFVIVGGIRVLRGEAYEMMIRGLRIIVFIVAFDAILSLQRGYLSLPFTIHHVGFAARGVAFPLLVILILLWHRKMHPRSPLARKPQVQQPLPLLRP